MTSRAGAALAEQVTLRTDRGDLSVLVVEPLTPGRLDALARHAAVSDVRAVLLCAGSEVHPSADIGRGAIVRTVEAGPGRPCAVEGSAPDPTSGLRAWLPLIVLIAVLAGAALLVRWLARELTEPIVALSRGPSRWPTATCRCGCPTTVRTRSASWRGTSTTWRPSWTDRWPSCATAARPCTTPRTRSPRPCSAPTTWTGC